MKPFIGNLERLTLENEDFRNVIFTANNIQLVLMKLLPGEDIGMEVHENIDQFFRFEVGTGKVIINEKEYDVGPGDSVIIPKGSNHNITNTSEDEDMKVYTIYSPPHHKDKTVRHIKLSAQVDSPEY
jgi:mannose-6-phosphate isomerase-like protein (cupin superfamily)